MTQAAYAAPSANAPQSPQTSPVRTPDTSPGNLIGDDSPGFSQASPKIGLTAREAAAALGRTVKRPACKKLGRSPGKHQGPKRGKSATATGEEICADPFRGVRPAGGAKEKRPKKMVAAKVRKPRRNLTKAPV